MGNGTVDAFQSAIVGPFPRTTKRRNYCNESSLHLAAVGDPLPVARSHTRLFVVMPTEGGRMMYVSFRALQLVKGELPSPSPSRCPTKGRQPFVLRVLEGAKDHISTQLPVKSQSIFAATLRKTLTTTFWGPFGESSFGVLLACRRFVCVTPIGCLSILPDRRRRGSNAGCGTVSRAGLLGNSGLEVFASSAATLKIHSDNHHQASNCIFWCSEQQGGLSFGNDQLDATRRRTATPIPHQRARPC